MNTRAKRIAAVVVLALSAGVVNAQSAGSMAHSAPPHPSGATTVAPTPYRDIAPARSASDLTRVSTAHAAQRQRRHAR
jgi:hypothetical protein